MGYTPSNDDDLLKRVDAFIGQSPTQPTGNSKAEALRRAADRLGVDAADLGAIISFESAGTFNPHKVGGEGNKYKGLIQFGPAEQKQYYKPNDTFETQVEDGVVRYFQDRFKQAGKDTRGATLEDLYTTVIAGNPKANRDAKDAFGTSARSGAQKILKEHRPKVLQNIFGGQSPSINDADFWDEIRQVVGQEDVAQADDSQFWGEIKNLVDEPSTVKPVTEKPETIDAQIQASLDPNVKTRFGVLTTDPSQNAMFGNRTEFTGIPTKEGTLWLNTKKIFSNKKLRLKNLADLRQYVEKNPNALTTLLGIAENVGNNTQGTAVVAKDADGNELAAGVVTNPASAVEQAKNYKDQFPNAQIEVTNTDDVVKARNDEVDLLAPTSPTGEADDPDEQGLLQARFAEAQKADPSLTVEKFNQLLKDENEQKFLADNANYAEFLKQTGLPNTPESQKEYNLAQQASVAGANKQNRIDVEAYNKALPRQGQASIQGQAQIETKVPDNTPRVRVTDKIEINPNEVPEANADAYISYKVAERLAQQQGVDPSVIPDFIKAKGGTLLIGDPYTPEQVAEKKKANDNFRISFQPGLGDDLRIFASQLKDVKDAQQTEASLTQKMKDEALASVKNPDGTLNPFDPNAWTLAFEKLITDPSNTTVSEDDLKRVVEANVEESIKQAGSATEAQRLREEGNKLSNLDKASRFAGSIAKTILKSPASFAKTIAWAEDTVDYLKSKGAIMPTLTSADLLNGVGWVISKTFGLPEKEKTKAGTLPMMYAKAVEDLFKDDPVTAQLASTKFANAIGSAVPFLVGATLSGGSTAAVAALGIGMQVGEMYDVAQRDGLSREKQLLSGALGIPIGASEVAGLNFGRLGALLNKKSGGTFGKYFLKWLLETGKEATEETIQEFLQSTAGDLVKTGMLKNGLTRQDVAKALGQSTGDAVTGGIVGALFGGGVPIAASTAGALTAPNTKARTDALLKTEPEPVKTVVEPEVPVEAPKAKKTVEPKVEAKVEPKVEPKVVEETPVDVELEDSPYKGVRQGATDAILTYFDSEQRDPQHSETRPVFGSKTVIAKQLESEVETVDREITGGVKQGWDADKILERIFNKSSIQVLRFLNISQKAALRRLVEARVAGTTNRTVAEEVAPAIANILNQETPVEIKEAPRFKEGKREKVEKIDKQKYDTLDFEDEIPSQPAPLETELNKKEIREKVELNKAWQGLRKTPDIKVLAKWVVDNSQIGDEIRHPDGSKYVITQRKTLKNGKQEIVLENFDEKGNAVNGNIQIITVKPDGSITTSLNGSIIANSYTDSNGKRGEEVTTYVRPNGQTKENIEIPSQPAPVAAKMDVPDAKVSVDEKVKPAIPNGLKVGDKVTNGMYEGTVIDADGEIAVEFYKREGGERQRQYKLDNWVKPTEVPVEGKTEVNQSKALRELGYTLPMQKKLSEAEKQEIVDKGIRRQDAEKKVAKDVEASKSEGVETELQTYLDKRVKEQSDATLDKLSDDDLLELYHSKRAQYAQVVKNGTSKTADTLDKHIEEIGNELAKRANLPEGTMWGTRGDRVSDTPREKVAPTQPPIAEGVKSEVGNETDFVTKPQPVESKEKVNAITYKVGDTVTTPNGKVKGTVESVKGDTLGVAWENAPVEGDITETTVDKVKPIGESAKPIGESTTEKSTKPEMLTQTIGGMTRRGYLIDDPKLGKRVQIVKDNGELGGTTKYVDSWKPVDQPMRQAITEDIYEQAKDDAGRIRGGSLEVRRLDSRGEQGRIKGGQRAVEASVLIGRDEAQRQEASQRGGSNVESRSDIQSRQEKLLETYAKREGIWYDWNKFFGDRHFTYGGEAFVYRQDGNTVVKTIDYRHIDKGLTPLGFLDNRIALYNHIFPETPYELMGITKDNNGKLRFVVKQPYIETRGVSKADVDAYMRSKGFEPTGRESYSNGIYQVFDVHEKNATQDAKGNIYIIDAVPKLVDESMYRPLTVEPVDQPMAQAVDNEDNVLKRTPNKEDIKSFENAQSIPARQLIQDVDFNKNARVVEDGVVAVDEIREVELIRRLINEANGTRGGAFYGVFNSKKLTRKFLDTLTKKIKSANEKGIDTKQLKTLKMLVTNASKQDGTVIFAMDEESLTHEKVHRALNRYQTGTSKIAPDVQDAITNSPIFKKVSEGKWGRAYAHANPANKVEEFITAASTLDWDALGIKSEADKRAAMSNVIDYYNSYAETNKGEGTAEEVLNALATEIAYVKEITNQDQKVQADEGTASEADGDSSIKDAERKEDRPDVKTEGKPDELKERKTVKTAHEYGLLNRKNTPEGTRYYTVKHNEPVERAAQEYVEQVGFDTAFAEAILAPTESNDIVHLSRQMAIIQLLDQQAQAARNAGNLDLYDYYETQSQSVMKALAPEATEAGQFIQLLSRWKITNPATVRARVRMNRVRNGLSPNIDPTLDQKLTEAAEKLQQAQAIIDGYEARLRDTENKESYTVKGRKTKPLTRTEKTVLDRFVTAREEALKRLRQDAPMLMAIAYDPRNASTPLAEDIEQDLVNVGVATLMEGWHGKPITRAEFDTQMTRLLGSQYSDHADSIYVKSVETMDNSLREQKQADQIARVRGEEGNELKTDDEIKATIADRKAKQRDNSQARAEHRRAVKKYKADNEYVEKVQELYPDITPEIMSGVLMRREGAISPAQMVKNLREEYPDQFRHQHGDTPEIRREKLRSLNHTIAEAEKAFKATNKALSDARKELRDAKLSPEQRRDLELAKRARSEGQKDLSTLVREAEVPKAGVLRSIAQISRAMKTALFQTAFNNVVSAKVEQTILNKPVDTVDILLQRVFKGLKNEGLTKDASIATAWWTPNIKKPVMDEGVKSFIKGFSKHEILLRVIDEHPEYFAKFFGDISPDLHSGVSKTLDKLMIPMRVQEFFMRDSEGVKALAQRAAMKGLDFKTILETGDYSAFDEADVEFALKRALDLTYASRPQHGEGLTASVFTGIASALRYSGFVDLIASEQAPFLNFMYNTINKYKSKIPVMAQMRLVGKTAATAKRLKRAGEEPHYIKEALREQWTSRQIADQMWGVVALGVMMSAVRALGDSDDWYLFKIPFTQGLGRDGGYLYFDIRTQPMLSPIAFIANKFNRLMNGKDAFTYDNGVSELAEPFLGISYRGAIEGNQLNQAALNLAYYALDDIKSGKDVEKNWDKFIHHLSKWGGNTLGTATNFLQFKTMKDILAQVDKDEQIQLRLTDRPFVQGLDSRLPESKRLLRDVLKMQVTEDLNYATGARESRNQYPALKIFGLNLRDEADVRKEPSQATILAAKLAYKDKSYTPPVLPKDVTAADVKRDFRRAGEKTLKDSPEAKSLLQKLQTFDEVLKQGQIKYASDKLFSSDLQDNFESLTYTEAERVFDVATAAEKSDLAEAYRKKLSNARRSNDKSRAEKDEAKALLKKYGWLKQ